MIYGPHPFILYFPTVTIDPPNCFDLTSWTVLDATGGPLVYPWDGAFFDTDGLTYTAFDQWYYFFNGTYSFKLEVLDNSTTTATIDISINFLYDCN